MKLLSHLVLLLLLALPLTAAAQPSDEDRATARSLAEQGQKALEAKDYETAADRFKRAEELFHAPTLLLGLARSYVGLGKYVAAQETYNKVIREELPQNANPKFREAQELAQAEVVGLDEKIGWVTIEVEGPTDPQVTLDGNEISSASLGVKRAIDPGDHVIKAEATGYNPKEAKFAVESGASQSVKLTMEENPDVAGPTGGGDEEASDTQFILGIAAVGVGGVSLIVGAVTGGLAMGKHGDLTELCPDNRCHEGYQSDVDQFRTLGTISTITFIAGGVLAATGVVLILTAPSDEPEGEPAPKAEVGFGLGHVQATFSW